MVFMGVSQHAEFDFDVRFARGDAHMLHPENTPEFNLKVALSPPGVLLVYISRGYTLPFFVITLRLGVMRRNRFVWADWAD